MFKKESNNYTASDIERYHRGLMSPAERHALERAALEDPFLEEALEGYARLAPGQASIDLSILRQRLANRATSHARAGAWWKIAAAFVLLAGAGALVYEHWWGGRPVGGLAEAKPAAPAKAKPAAPVTARTATAPVATQTAASPVTARTVTAPTAPAPATPIPAPPRSTTTAAAPTTAHAAPARLGTAAVTPSTKVVHTDKQAADVAAVAPAPLVDTAIAHALASKASGLMAAPMKAENNFQNRVTDTRNQPISYASIRLLPSGHTVSADQNGYFRLSTADTSAQVQVTAVGYAPRRFDAGELKSLPSLQLKEDTTSLEDRVVVGTYRAASVKDKARLYHEVTDTAGAQPLEGWNNYNAYLVGNIQYPEEALQNHIHGSVDLHFQVDDSGKPTNIVVAKSLCGSCDAEAIRLLLQGPGWRKAAGGKKPTGKLRVQF